VDDGLRSLWDFHDLDESERRLRAQLERETDDDGRADVLTQIARLEGLRTRFDEGHRLLDEARALASPGASATAWILLERGRLLRSAGDPAGGLPLFEEAFGISLAGGLDFAAADAAHMAAIASGDLEGRRLWTERGVAVAEASDAAEYWLGPLLNNLGWAYFEAGDHEAALEVFERALAARERRPEQPGEIEIARYAVAKALRVLGRPAEAVPLLERAVAWSEAAGQPDGFFHEEIALVYAALGRVDEARGHARRALQLLHRTYVKDAERARRLRELAGEA
jgi:tetratricopeptide (TPR) repeat protein